MKYSQNYTDDNNLSYRCTHIRAFIEPKHKWYIERRKEADLIEQSCRQVRFIQQIEKVTK